VKGRIQESPAIGTAAAAAAVVLATIVPLGAAAAADAAPGEPERVAAAVRLMAPLRAESLDHARRIRDLYGADAARPSLVDRAALLTALYDRRLVPVPVHRMPGEIRLRLLGEHPIGELDLRFQPFYLAARPETIGCLFVVASRVRSGPLDVTSLVRHAAYQRRLARRNANAVTDVPTHVAGLAFDVSIFHAPPSLARELRDVLRAMAAAGDLYFIAEQRQLVFHVVPAPDRSDYYAAIAAALAGRAFDPVVPAPPPLPPVAPPPAQTVVAGPPALLSPRLPTTLGRAAVASMPTATALGVWLIAAGGQRLWSMVERWL
jgi:hypothetical protein